MKHKLLLVDDDQTLLQMTRSLLERDGYEVHVHTSAFGTEALVRQLAPHLILLDVNMPGLSGDRLVSVLRESRSDISKIPILFYSAIDEPLLRTLTAQHGVQGYVLKGNPAELRTRIASCLYSPVASSR
jgi:CheY-like chemotaxis protein